MFRVTPSIVRHAILVLLVSMSFGLMPVGEATAQEQLSGEEARRVEQLAAEASALFDAGQYKEAIAAYEAVYEKQHDLLPLWNIARAWQELGDLRRARARFEFLLGFEYDDPRIQAERGALLEQQKGRAREQIAQIDQRLEARAARMEQAEQALPNQPADALEHFEAARAIMAGADVQWGLARAHHALGHLEEASLALQVLLASEVVDAELRVMASALSEKIAVALRPAPMPEPGAAADTGEGWRWAGWMMVGAGGALSVASLIYYTTFSDQIAEFERLHDGDPRIDPLKEELGPKQTAFGVLLGSGVGIMALGTISVIIGHVVSPDEHITVEVSPVGVALSTRF